MKNMSISWIVIGVGAIVALIGWTMLTGPFAAGVIGFGLAHIFLGILDMFRPALKNRETA